MRRRSSTARWVAVLALAAAACGNGPASGTGTSSGDARLRAAAALAPCPAGISAALPDLTLPCLGGGDDVSLRAAGTGHPTLVNVWATWCGPCVREVPELVDLAQNARGRVDVVGVLTQDTPENALEFARQFGMHYPSVVDDDGTVLRKFSPGPPATLFLDASGRLKFVQRGEIKNAQALRALLRQYLQVDLPLTAGPSPGPP
ncbi:MAG: TlpA family protein disulfide reductase [Actinobacteria bacterium]|nr:TlpA family protein disulfide reductase [Actinomycetota bacterium]